MKNKVQKHWNAKETFWLMIVVFISIMFINNIIDTLTIGWRAGSMSDHGEISDIIKNEKILLINDFDFKIFSYLITAIISTLMLYMLAKAKCSKPMEHYFALGKKPHSKHIRTFFLLYITYLIFVYFISQSIDIPDNTQYMKNFYNMDFIFIGLIIVCFIAPIAEEIFYRGFLFKGWSTSKLGVNGSIFIISILFILMHGGQYDLSTLLILFPLALLLGFARYHSGSLWLSISIHSINNIVAATTYFFP
jgi:membrane protease YdiL (CAAX protease family)